MNSKKRVTIGVVVTAVVILGIVFGVRIGWAPAPAIVQSIALESEAVAVEDGVFVTDVIEVDATLAGLSWRSAPPRAASVRTSEDGVTWSDWIDLELGLEHAPDLDSPESEHAVRSSEPVYFGPVSYLQYRVEPEEGDTAEEFKAEVVETSGRGLSLRQKVMRFVDSIEVGLPEASGVPNQPNIQPAESWGSDQCLAGTQPRTLPEVHRVETIIVHHAGNNSYASGQASRDLVYSICTYHVSSRGWWDIAYNFLVDRYGVIYEGRRGSLEAQIQGGHTSGFNSYSVGVAMLGNHAEQAPTAAAWTALEWTLAWTADRYHIDPEGSVVVESLGSAKWPEGTLVTLGRISGHRDAQATACPGDFCYSQLPTVRSTVAGMGQPKFYVDFSDFDPIVGSGGELTIEAPSGHGWSVTVEQRNGPVVWNTSGSGTDTVSWSGNVTNGPYLVTVSAGSLGTHEQWVQVGAYEWPFVDDEGSYAGSEIRDMWKRSVTEGCDWNDFCPSRSLTRAELATLVARLMDSEGEYPSYQGYFTDAPAGAWFTGPLEFLVQEGVIEPGGAFGVNYAATRVLTIDLVLNALNVSSYPEYQGYFTDVPAGAWFTPKVEKAHEMGIALGFPDGTFRPFDVLTREEGAALLMRGLE